MADWLPPPPPVDPPVIPPEEPTTTTVAVVTPPTYGVETPWIILSVLGVLMFLISFGFFVSKRFPSKFYIFYLSCNLQLLNILE